MKVLLAFPQRDKQTGLFIKNALEQLGCDIVICDPKVEPQTLYSKCQAFSPELVVCSRTPSLAPGIKQYKKENPKCVFTCWNVDVKNKVNDFGMNGLFSVVDIMYTVAEGNLDGYKKICKDVRLLHQGLDPQTHNKPKYNLQDEAKYGCDVMWAGTVHGHPAQRERIELLNGITRQGYKVKLYGCNGVPQIFDQEHNKACFYSKIVLSHVAWSHLAMRSVRDYKVMGAGGFLLARKSIGLDNTFNIGEHLVAYESVDQCLNLIKHYLTHEQDRKQIANNGYIIAHKQHRYYDRMKQIIKDVQSI